jgi:hypothetical protein
MSIIAKQAQDKQLQNLNYALFRNKQQQAYQPE